MPSGPGRRGEDQCFPLKLWRPPADQSPWPPEDPEAAEDLLDLVELRPMRTLAVSSGKGGVGKTSFAVNVGAVLAAGGLRVLLVDLDGQGGGATLALGVRDDGEDLAEALAGAGPLPIKATSPPGLSLVPSGLAVGRAERALAGEPGAEGVLRGKLDLVDGRFDLAIVDTAPGLGTLSVAALVAADRAIVPVTPNALALGALRGTLAAVEKIKARLNPGLALAGLALSMIDRRTALHREVEEDLRRRFPELVLAATVRRTVKIEEAAGAGVPVGLHAPDSTAAEDYKALAGELAGRIGLSAPARAAAAS